MLTCTEVFLSTYHADVYRSVTEHIMLTYEVILLTSYHTVTLLTNAIDSYIYITEILLKIAQHIYPVHQQVKRNENN